MPKSLMGKRVVELGALFLIGDGIMGLLRPRGHSLLWHVGPELVKAATEELSSHRKTSRAFHLAEIAAGLALVTQTRAF